MTSHEHAPTRVTPPWWAQRRASRIPSERIAEITAEQDAAFARRRKGGKKEVETVRNDTPPAPQPETQQNSDEVDAYPHLPHRHRRHARARARALRTLASHETAATRIHNAHAERMRRMRSNDARRNDKRMEYIGQGYYFDIPHEERVRRIHMLLRSGVYDTNRIPRLPEMVSIPMTRTVIDARTGKSGVERYTETVPRSTLLQWFQALLPHEQQRLYVLGRERYDFVFRESDYPHLAPDPKDTPRERAEKQAALEKERLFQTEQKWLADGLEVVAIPLFKEIFTALGCATDVYLMSKNDDIAGGLDIGIDFKDTDGNPLRFPDGNPMRMTIDVTYARMKDKVSFDARRERICAQAVHILSGNKKNEVPNALGNARAMKMFRTVVDVIGGTMSTQTFDAHGPLIEPQHHIPRLVIGIDWENAFNAITEWALDPHSFSDTFARNPLAQRIAQSIGTQLTGLNLIALRSSEHNPNSPYLRAILQTIQQTPRTRGTIDESLRNIDDLVAPHTLRLHAWKKERMVAAAIAQVEYNKKGGGHRRGDGVL